MEHEFAAARRRVDALLQAAKTDTARFERAHGVDEVAKRAAKPIELPDNERVTGAHEVERLGQASALGDPARRDIDEHALASGRLQGVVLKVEALVVGRAWRSR